MRVAIVSYYTPPQSAIASHRVLRLTRCLLAAGHDVHWVTADPDRISATSLDPSLGALLPAAVTVHGIDGQALITKPAAANLWEKVWRNVAYHAPRMFAWPDSFLSWSRQLKRRLPDLVRSEAIDAVFVCCSPHNQILALPALRRGCPDISILVDYRDLLSGNPWNSRASESVAARVAGLERRTLACADVLFLNTDLAKTRFTAAVGEVPGLSIEVMRNAADFTLADEVAAGHPEPDLGPGVHLGFFGAIFERRRMAPVLEAIAEIPVDRREHLHLHVYCDAHDSARLLAEDLEAVAPDVRRHVTRHDYLGYAQALRTMQAMDALLLVNGPEASDSVFVPGKLFDYLMARRPVLFVGHPGEARDVVARTSGEEWCFGYGESQAAASRVVSLLEDTVPDLSPTPEYSPEAAFAPLLRRLE